MRDRAEGDVVVVGSIHVDVVMEVAAIPQEGETVLADAVHEGHGGKGANQAVAAAARGARVAVLGAVGDDAAGRAAVAALAEAGLDVTGVAVAQGATTARAVVVVDAAGRNAIVVDPGASRRVDPGAVARELSRRRPAVVLVQRELPAAVVAEALRAARAAGATTVLNAAPAEAAGSTGVPWDAVDVLVVNAAEAGALLGTAAPSQPQEALAAARGLLGLGPPRAVVTLGGDGVVAVTDDGAPALSLPAAPTTVVDTTGAGDAFCGGLAASLAGGEALEAAVRAGLAAGALAVATRGARLPPVPPR